MSPVVIIVIALAALFSTPAAFVFLWLLYRQSREPAVRDLALVILGLLFILLCNLLTALFDGLLHLHDDALFLLFLDATTLSTIMVGGFLCRFAHRATQSAVSPALRLLFWGTAFVLHSAVLAVTLLLTGRPGGFHIGAGFAGATLGGAFFLGYATAIIVVRRGRIPRDFPIPMLPAFFLVLLALELLAVANDLSNFGERLGGSNFPFSPFFMIIVDTAVIVIAARTLSARSAPLRGRAGELLDPRLTAREAEILPLLLGGSSNEEIGAKLFISAHTVKNHVTSIFRKTGTENRFDLLKSFQEARSPSRPRPREGSEPFRSPPG